MSASRRDFLKVSGMAGVGVISNIFTWDQATTAMKRMDKVWTENQVEALSMVEGKYFDLYRGEGLNRAMVTHVDDSVRHSVFTRIGIADRIKALDLELDVVTLRPDQLLYGFLKRHEIKNRNDDNRHWLVARLIDERSWKAGCRGVEHTGITDKKGLIRHGTRGWVHENVLIADIPAHLQGGDT